MFAAILEQYPHLVPFAQEREILRISVTTQWRLRKAGKLPAAVTVGGQKFVPAQALVAFLENGGTSSAMPKKRGRPVGSRNRNRQEASHA